MPDRNRDLYIRGLIITYVLFCLTFGALTLANVIHCNACSEVGNKVVSGVALTLGVLGVLSFLKFRRT